ncbi:MAG TPA: lysophospholipid acyltransferase family protein [Deltaproteobacteria bacterium]|nr:lysophospholipid acyltransferase family protein [Deltaproteobacteria bacterium]HPR56018.1 lysophospholipid acyltransferase family protein [Deltaproteobacteria bacterium]HXK46985.1 lysophospholipid acyltransferase family protein [Deltaproteobacteria bacterium]
MISSTIKAAWTIVTTVIYTVIICIPIILVAPFSPQGKATYRLGWTWAWLLMKTNRVRMQVEGLEKVLCSRSYVFIANHASNLDPPAVALALKNQLRFIGKKSLARVPLFGSAVRLARMILIDRDDSHGARRTIDMAITDLRDGISAIFFAEGTRSVDGRLQAFKKGGVMLALKAKLPIVPITIVNSHRLLPKNAVSIKAGLMRIIIGDPIDTSGYGEQDRDLLTELVRSVIGRNLELCNQG